MNRTKNLFPEDHEVNFSPLLVLKSTLGITIISISLLVLA